MIYPITMYGDPVLRQKAADIAPGSDITQLIEDMFDTMHNAMALVLRPSAIGSRYDYLGDCLIRMTVMRISEGLSTLYLRRRLRTWI